MTISPEIIKLSPADAYRHYRDSLGWQVYPVYPPGVKCSDPGKQPAVKAWWDFDPQDCDVDRWFHNGHPHNIGVAPKGGLVIIDLDSKADQGASVRQFLGEHSDLKKVPRHVTRGGVHLVMVCPDLPVWKAPNGKPYHGEVIGQINQCVSAEFFYCDRQNIVVPPSKHPSGLYYTWDAFGDVVGWPWDHIRDLFCFVEPTFTTKRKPEKDAPWHLQFRGALATLDLVGLLEEIGVHAELQDADEARYIIPCPWASEHSTQGEPDARIWQSGVHCPGFKCHHAHCSGRTIKDVLEWAESKDPGIVDRFCARLRVWEDGQLNVDGRPRVLHAIGRLESEVYTEVGNIIGPRHAWFVRANTINVITEVPSGFIYSDNPEEQFTVAAHTIGFSELTAIQAKSSLEEYIEPGILKFTDNGTELEPKSFSSDFCCGMIQSAQLKRKLPLITRLLTVALPFHLKPGLVRPKAKYDPQFGTYLIPDAPRIWKMSLAKAKEILERLHAGFCFTTEQSRTHAIARLITPFGRAMIGWTERIPLWFYIANRPRAGKDYLAAIPLLVYEGIACEDLPIGKESEETGKRIMSAARNGRRFMHFSNCQVYLQDQYLIQAITNPVINGRRLGSNDASSDLSIPNEIEFSVSANVGLTYREDLGPRMRKIELAYYEEDPNSRTFPNPFLHRTIKDNRSLVLSAISALYENWAALGFPKGKTCFSSFPKWAEIVGGVMLAAGLGDPCLPWEGEFDDGGDLKTKAMKALFMVCYQRFGDTWVLKKQIYQCVQEEAKEHEALQWFGDVEGGEDARKNQTRLGLLLSQFKGRILGDIQLFIDTSAAKSESRRFKFTKKAQKPETSGTSGTFGGRSHVREVKQFVDNVHVDDVGHNLDEALHVPEVPEVSGTTAIPRETGFLALDLETCAEVKVSRRGKTPKITTSVDALRPWKGSIRLVAVSDDGGNIQLFDLQDGTLPNVICSAIEHNPLIIHNAAFDLLFMDVLLGIKPKSVFCTLTASRLLTPSKIVPHSLGEVLKRHLGIEIPKEHGDSDWGSLVLTDDQIEYTRNDVRYLHQLKGVLEAELEKADLTKVFKLESDLIPVVVGIERTGFAVDSEKMRNMLAEAKARQNELQATLRTKFGIPTLNPGSSEQVVEAFKTVGETIPNASEETLATVNHALAPMVIEYHGAAKSVGTIAGLLKQIQSDGRIHARFQPLGTDTGRFSSSKPNLQNIDRGPLRSCFIPSAPDRRLIVADYSQIELRIGAIFAKDAVMLDAFRAGEDLHRKTAAGALSKSVDDVVKDDRQLAKAINFGFLYGQQAEGFRLYAKTNYGISVSLEDAAEFRSKFFEQYKGLARWHKAAWNAVASVTEARTILGRMVLPRGDKDWGKFQMQTNYVVQGSASDVIKVAMVKLRYRLPALSLVATVHDELVCDVPAEGAESTCALVRTTMIDAFTEVFGDIIPMEVEAKVCANWGEK